MIDSPLFWVFLGLAVPLNWLLPYRLRSAFVSAISIGFMACYDLWSVVGVCLWSLLIFWLVRWAGTRPDLAKRRAAFAVIVGVLSWLAYHKYLPPLISALLGDSTVAILAIPLGISYFTFKAIHYTVETLRGNTPPHRGSDFACYMFLFPIYSAGPIERIDHFVNSRQRHFDFGDFSLGLTRIAHGLIKKFVVIPGVLIMASQISPENTIQALLANLDTAGPLTVAVFLIQSFLIGYLDFSAYSDIAIGGSRLFGFRIMENFNWPILASNIGDFWRRWHMTLAGWCQSYVYMPFIGLTRRPILAIYATFLTMGLWHAGSLFWVAWGIHHATGVAVYVYWLRSPHFSGLKKRCKGVAWKCFSRALTLIYVSLPSAYITVHTMGGDFSDSLRILARLLGINFG